MELELPPPSTPEIGKTLIQCIKERRSVREYIGGDITPQQLSDLLWSAYGISGDDSKRTAPSPCAVFAAHVTVILRDGVFTYDSVNHKLIKEADGPEALEQIADIEVARGLRRCKNISAVIAIGSNPEPIPSSRFNEQAHPDRWAILEVGCMGQNIMLQAVNSGLVTVMAGAYNDDKVHKIARFPESTPVHVCIVVGRV